MNKDLFPSPVSVLSGYIKSRYDINESFENLINALKAKEIEYTELFEKQIIDAYNEGYKNGRQSLNEKLLK